MPSGYSSAVLLVGESSRLRARWLAWRMPIPTIEKMHDEVHDWLDELDELEHQ